MPLAVMTGATLGHTGRPLEANLVTQAIYTSVLLGALARIAASLTGSLALLEIAGTLWIAGFAGFAFAYGPLLITRKPAWTEARS